MNYLLLFFCLSLSVTSAGARTLYAYTDANGIVHVSFSPTAKKKGKRVSAINEVPSRAQQALQALSSVNHQMVSSSGDLPLKSKNGIKDFSDLMPVIEHAANFHGIDSRLLNAIITVESGHNQDSISSKGALGLMQLMPKTARWLADKEGIKVASKDTFLIPEVNIKLGASYVKYLLDRYDGDVRLALAAYNSGEGNVEKYNRNIPPFQETQRYVAKVMSIYNSGS